MRNGNILPLWAFTLVAVHTLGCETEPDPNPPSVGTTANVSNPRDGLGNEAFLLASETSVLYLPQYEGRVVVAYNDQSGAFDIQDIGGTKTIVPKSIQSLNGVSYSNDTGMSWIKNGPIPPASSNCGDPECAVWLRGDPWLTVTPTKVLYSSMATTNTDPAVGPNAIAVATSIDGGISWSSPRIAHYLGSNLDKPSMSSAESAVVISYISGFATGNVFLITSLDEGNTWTPQIRLDAPDDDYSQFPPIESSKMNPIVRLGSPTVGYVSYQRINSGIGDWSMNILRITRPSPQSTQWMVDPAFVYTENVTADTTVDAALQRKYRDLIPTSFDIGEDGQHLYFAYAKHELSGSVVVSVITFADCFDQPVGTCTVVNGMLSSAWRIKTFRPQQGEGGMHQPSVAASRITGDRTVALAWYQKMSASNVDTEPHGHFSIDGGATWSSVRDLTLAQPAFQPCPTKAVDSTGAGYFGDYFGSAIIPATGQPVTATRVVTAYASSSHGCQELDQVTFDQHVQGVRW